MLTGISPICGIELSSRIVDVPSMDTGSSRSLRFARFAIPPLLGLAFVSLVVEVVLVELGPGSSDVMVRDALVTTVAFAAAVATLLAAVTRPAGMRAPWLALGLGILSYSSAPALLLRSEGPDDVPQPRGPLLARLLPSLSQPSFCLPRQRRSDRLGISLDATIIALAIAALGYELIFNRLINASLASEVVGANSPTRCWTSRSW